MQFLTLIHEGGGSMYEGSGAQYVFGTFDTNAAAAIAGDDWLTAADAINPQRAKEYWYTVVPVPDPTVMIEDQVRWAIEQFRKDFGD